MCVISECFVFFYFFKQKTAYEMRISDWSSDVCSSDLGYTGQASTLISNIKTAGNVPINLSWFQPYPGIDAMLLAGSGRAQVYYKPISGQPPIGPDLSGLLHRVTGKVQRKYGKDIETGEVIRQSNRSEEHTSELQSLMRI